MSVMELRDKLKNDGYFEESRKSVFVHPSSPVSAVCATPNSPLEWWCEYSETKLCRSYECLTVQCPLYKIRATAMALKKIYASKLGFLISRVMNKTSLYKPILRTSTIFEAKQKRDLLLVVLTVFLYNLTVRGKCPVCFKKC